MQWNEVPMRLPSEDRVPSGLLCMGLMYPERSNAVENRLDGNDCSQGMGFTHLVSYLTPTLLLPSMQFRFLNYIPKHNASYLNLNNSTCRLL